jgi:N-acetylneuraminic acid mutarotase
LGEAIQTVQVADLRKCSVLIVTLLFCFAEVHAQHGWTRKEDMPTGRAGPVAAVVDNKIYVLGGFNANLSNFDANEVYDPSTDTWETKKPLPARRALVSAAVVNDTIYAIGGGFPDSTREVHAYDPVTDTWTRRRNMLSARFGAAAGVIDGIIYNVGGNHTDSNCEAYNPATDTWTRKRDIPETYGGIAVAPYDGLLYAFGGGFNEVFSTAYVYDPKTDQWTKKKDMRIARGWSYPAPVVGGKIYVIGGYASVRGDVLSEVDVYDPESDSWTKKPDAPFKKAMFGVAVANGKIYIIGGTSNWTDSGSKEVWEYDPAVATGAASPSELPRGFVLERNYPNPFNRATVIRYAVGRTSLPAGNGSGQGSGIGNVKLVVYDLLGREVAVLVNEKQVPNTYEVRFDATGLPSGIFIYRLTSGAYVASRKMAIIR